MAPLAASRPRVATVAASVAVNPSTVGTSRLANGQLPLASRKLISLLLVGAVLTVLLILKSSEGVAAALAASTSLDTELEIRTNATKDLGNHERLLPAGHPDSVVVERVATQLVSAVRNSSRYIKHYNFRVIQTADTNAFALPAGAIYISTGMLDLVNRDENLIAAVLAHEIAHVESQHGLRLRYQDLAVGAAVLWTFGFASEPGLQVSNAVVNSRYSRQLELEADAFGYKLLADAGYQAKSMADLMRRLASIQARGRGPEWLSSHPESLRRADALDSKRR